jgi:hypothetical protein
VKPKNGDKRNMHQNQKIHQKRRKQGSLQTLDQSKEITKKKSIKKGK